MEICVEETGSAAGARAAERGVAAIRQALQERGAARIIVATGESQFPVFEALTAADLDWRRITVFHLDEYVGLRQTHQASFRRYLKERFAERLSPSLAALHYIDAEENPLAECARVGALLQEAPIDLAFVGIGENGHLAFNDPLADFDTESPYIVVDLDMACRQQQVNEGWFATLDAVPTQAISMSIRQIMKSLTIICTAPGTRKAVATQATIEGSVTAAVPASILQTHADCTLFLDNESAAQLDRLVTA